MSNSNSKTNMNVNSVSKENKNQDKILLTSFKQTYIDMLKLYF